MSATHTTLPAIASAKAGPYDPRTIEDLETVIAEKIKTGEKLAAALRDAHSQRLAGRQPNPPAWVIWRKLDRLEEELQLLLSDLDRRRI